MKINYKLFIYLFIALPIFCNATIYQNKDHNGNVNFSDQASPGSIPVILNPINIAPGYVGYSAKNNHTPPVKNETTTLPSTFEITNPANEQSFYNHSPIKITIAVTPGLENQEKIALFIDNKLLQTPSVATEYNLQNLDRGEHEIYAELSDGDGKIIMRSNSIKIYIISPVVS